MKLSHIYFQDGIEGIVNNEIRGPLERLNEQIGGVTETARSLKWRASIVESFLASDPLPNYPEGRSIFELSEEDLRRYSPSRLRRMVRAAIAIAVAHLGTPDDIALFLGIKEDQVRRHHDAALRLLGRARLDALSGR
jgi:hypothetical protein